MPHSLFDYVSSYVVMFLLFGCLFWLIAVVRLLRESNKATPYSMAGFAIGLVLMYYFPTGAVVWVLGGITAGAGIGAWLDGVYIWPPFGGGPSDEG